MRKMISGLLAVLLLAGCGTKPAEEPLTEPETAAEEIEMEELELYVNDQKVEVLWEDNASVKALKEAVKDQELLVEMNGYGGFEQVGSLGRELPADDEPLTSQPGDIFLYSSDQIVIFYGSNSWSYTKLGQIKGLDEEELKALLKDQKVTLTIK